MNGTCMPCSVCPVGYGVQTNCQRTQDTVCKPCTHKQFSRYINGNRFCTNCTKCAAEQTFISDCTHDKDTVCGGCIEGYFLQVNRDGNTQCSKCSRCPSGGNAVKWYDCLDLPEDHQCAPGISIHNINSNSEGYLDKEY